MKIGFHTGAFNTSYKSFEACLQWARLLACPSVDTTDGLHKPEGLSDALALNLMKTECEQIIEVAEAHQVVVNIEPHGCFTTRPDMMERMLAFCSSPYLRMNMDTGTTFIAGQDPVAFLGRFIAKVSPVHIKELGIPEEP